MGYWFENMEKMDIQAERRNTAEAREELEKTRRELERAEKKADKAKKEADKALTGRIRSNIEICQELGLSKEETYIKVLEKSKEFYKGLSKEEIKTELEAEINKYWK